MLLRDGFLNGYALHGKLIRVHNGFSPQELVSDELLEFIAST